MKRPRHLVLLALLAAAAGCARDPGPGAVAPADPLQGDPAGEDAVVVGDYRLDPLATFDVQARVLSAERYRFDREADLAPVDLALGWGPMSDSAVLESIGVHQGLRMYAWSTRSFPIPREDIEAHSANVHVIPATGDVARRLKRLGEGDVVRIRGLLVEASAPDGWRWTSSLSRQDTGLGACELLYARSIEVR